MADTKPNEPKISIKVFVDKVKKRVVYAEADYTFVDILFSFITLPLGTIVRLLGKLDDKKFESLGSLNNLYQSLKDFPFHYLSSLDCKPLLLNPRSLLYDHCQQLNMKIDDTEPMKCGLSSRGQEVGYKEHIFPYAFFDRGVLVSSTATFIVTDDLRVMPYTSANSIQLLADLGITDKSRLDDIKLDMDCKQILYVLKMALSPDNSILTPLVFQKDHSIRDLVVHDQSCTFELSDILKKEESVSLKFDVEVSLQKSTGKLLFAETKEDFVEFLFGVLSIPLGTVIGDLIKGDFRCMDNIYRSISNLSVGRYLVSQNIKDMLLQPHIGQQFTSKNHLFCLKGTSYYTNKPVFMDYKCDNNGKHLKFGIYIVMDDLIITRSSSETTMNTLNDLKVLFDDVEKYVISIGLSEGLKLLKSSLRSCSTLTDSIGHLLKK